MGLDWWGWSPRDVVAGGVLQYRVVRRKARGGHLSEVAICCGEGFEWDYW